MNMGSFMSQPLESDKVAAPPEAASSASPAPMDKPRTPTSAEQPPVFNNCWSCRVLSGSGLIGAGGYVYWVARKPLKLGYAPSPGTITQMVIGISIACWGVVILSDPKGKAFRVG
ncbi:distal membrane-arm assembly complex protein 1 isoform X2 [Phyllostomus hastatus]|uniref:distal membrane-arm assembly complex protein 1 isoform X2 n=1 Tax=Phyllostomus hastatus TaxID=9423 RepID=UPI001E681917|nr:distal membrane-arm assembly complex protein 1 isoform X2 [Phyllostomus hastatus]